MNTRLDRRTGRVSYLYGPPVSPEICLRGRHLRVFLAHPNSRRVTAPSRRQVSWSVLSLDRSGPGGTEGCQAFMNSTPSFPFSIGHDLVRRVAADEMQWTMQPREEDVMESRNEQPKSLKLEIEDLEERIAPGVVLTVGLNSPQGPHGACPNRC